MLFTIFGHSCNFRARVWSPFLQRQMREICKIQYGLAPYLDMSHC
jgi:hypothetical protein